MGLSFGNSLFSSLPSVGKDPDSLLCCWTTQQLHMASGPGFLLKLQKDSGSSHYTCDCSVSDGRIPRIRRHLKEYLQLNMDIQARPLLINNMESWALWHIWNSSTQRLRQALGFSSEFSAAWAIK